MDRIINLRKSTLPVPRSSRRSWFSVGIVSVLLCGAMYTVLSLENTIAVFGDNEHSQGNTQGSSSLDFILNDSGWSPASEALALTLGDTIMKTITVIDDVGVDFKYVVQPVKTGGSDQFCSALRLKATLEGVDVYDAGLLYFSSTTLPFGSTTDDWTFQISLMPDIEITPGEACQFDFVFQGWQKEYSGTTTGYHDTETSDNIIQGYVVVVPDAVVTLDATPEPEVTESPTPTPSEQPSPTPTPLE